ncbi:MAG: hypothetical protein FWE84_05500 [Firmicutes bacterium]|nr:hypothetical protein [Bacillota bacterium]
MLTTLFLYIFGFFFIKMKTRMESIIRICISSALGIFCLVGAIAVFAEDEADFAAFFAIILMLLFALRVAFDGKTIYKNQYEDLNKAPKIRYNTDRAEETSLCSKCGFKIFPEDKVCPSCGHNVSNETKPFKKVEVAPITEIKSMTQGYMVKQTKEQKWEAQKKIDKEILDRDDKIANQMLAAVSTINAMWEANTYFDKESKNSRFHSELYLRALSAELFLRNYYLFKIGNYDDIKDSIYTERPYIVLDTLIKMGLYIFQTNNNIAILEFIINSTEADFASAKALARQILAQEQ